MTGDIQDFVSRLRSALPSRWFPDNAPILEVLLSGIAWCWAWLYEGVAYVRLQTRISTATDFWLDAVARDYFAPGVCQRNGRSDDAYRRDILTELLRERGTRYAVSRVVEDLTGRTPRIFEPANAMDTGGYGPVPAGTPGLAYGIAGGWGSLMLPFQTFITAYRPVGVGIACVCGWSGYLGGYGTGLIEYASLDMIAGRVTDADINQAIASVAPIASTCWTQISS